MAPINRDIDRLELIIELIGDIQRRIDLLDENRFLSDRDEIDLTSFRLLHIGETTHKLSTDLKARHPDIPWAAIYQMRNIIGHDYPAVQPLRIWETATTRLQELLIMCRTELDRLLK